MKNKIIFSYLLMTLALIGKAQAQAKDKLQGEYTITLNLNQLARHPNYVYFGYINAAQKVIEDTAIIKNGKVVFKGSIQEPLMATITTQPSNNILYFYLSAENITITSGNSLNTSIISGATYQRDFEVIDNQQKLNNQRNSPLFNALNIAMKAKDSVKIKLIDDSLLYNREEMGRYYKSFLISNAKSSPLSVFALVNYINVALNLKIEQADSLYNLLSVKYKNLPTAKALKVQLDIKKNTSVGRKAPDFMQPDTSGKMIKLSSFRNKYVLLDFWASWCKPCRAQIPDLITIYNKYKDKNFEILGVSLDGTSAKREWLKAVRQDHANWTQLYTPGAPEDKKTAVNLYYVKTVPHNLLIGPDGKIIAIDLAPEKLDKKLTELLIH